MRAALARAARGDLTSDDQDSPQEKFTALGLDFWEDLGSGAVQLAVLPQRHFPQLEANGGLRPSTEH
jgi:hypothetical protein